MRLHGFEAATDTEIWNFAKIREFVIVTRDVDFFERSLILGSPPKVLWLNCGNSSTDYVLDLILQRSEEIRTLDSDPTLSCLELV